MDELQKAIHEAMKTTTSPVLETNHIARLATKQHGVDSRHPDYRKVLRALNAMEAADVVASYSTTMNNRVWWLTERMLTGGE